MLAACDERGSTRSSSSTTRSSTVRTCRTSGPVILIKVGEANGTSLRGTIGVVVFPVGLLEVFPCLCLEYMYRLV